MQFILMYCTDAWNFFLKGGPVYALTLRDSYQKRVLISKKGQMKKALDFLI